MGKLPRHEGVSGGKGFLPSVPFGSRFADNIWVVHVTDLRIRNGGLRPTKQKPFNGTIKKLGRLQSGTTHHVGYKLRQNDRNDENGRLTRYYSNRHP